MSLPTQENWTRQEQLRAHLRMIALSIDPDARFDVLAQRLGKHPVQPSLWIKKGYVPYRTANFIVALFGKVGADLDVLCPQENRPPRANKE